MKTELVRRLALRYRIEAYFRAHPRQWIDAETLMELGGSLAWRTRVSECRRVFKGESGVLENRQERLGPRVNSSYRYLPHTPLGRDAAARVDQKSLFG